MKSINLTLLIYIYSLSFISYSQTAPLYGPSNRICTVIQSLTMPSAPSAPSYSFTLSPCFPISTKNYRKPFVSISSYSNLLIDSNQFLHMQTQIISSSSSFQIRLKFVASGAAPSASWCADSIYRLHYMIISDSIPDSFITAQLIILNNGNSVRTAGQVQTGFVYTAAWFGMSPIVPITYNSYTKFVFAITSIELKASISSLNSFSMNLEIAMASSNSLKYTITTKYAQTLMNIIVSLFIYQPGQMQSFGFKINQAFYISPAFATSTTILYSIYPWHNYPGFQLIMGLRGFQFSGYSHYGFQFTADLTVQKTTLTLGVDNLFINSVQIGKLEVTLFSIQQLSCPPGSTTMNTALTQCYSTCPIGFSAAASMYGFTGIHLCQPCVSNCCPAGQLYNALAPSCTPCGELLPNCVDCTSSTKCIGCISGYDLNATDQCQIVCSVGCSNCNPTQCLTCSSPFLLNSGACVCPIGQFFNLMISTCDYCAPITGCINCDSITNCLACNTGYFVDSNHLCTPCSPGCRDCTISGCTSCLSGLNLISNACFCNPGYYYDTSSTSCIACPTSLIGCIQCSSSIVCIACHTGYYRPSKLMLQFDKILSFNPINLQTFIFP